jgi:hypothetical protein
MVQQIRTSGIGLNETLSATSSVGLPKDVCLGEDVR